MIVQTFAGREILRFDLSNVNSYGLESQLRIDSEIYAGKSENEMRYRWDLRQAIIAIHMTTLTIRFEHACVM